MDQLTPSHKLVVSCTHSQGYKHKEIAKLWIGRSGTPRPASPRAQRLRGLLRENPALGVADATPRRIPASALLKDELVGSDRVASLAEVNLNENLL